MGVRKTMRAGIIVVAMAFCGPVLATPPAAIASYPADRADIGQNGERVRVAVVPGVFQVRYNFDTQGNFLYSAVIDLKTKKVIGVGDPPTHSGPDVQPADSGPPANFTGIHKLADFPGGGSMYRDYVSGQRVGTIPVQPDGSITYVKMQ